MFTAVIGPLRPSAARHTLLWSSSVTPSFPSWSRSRSADSKSRANRALLALRDERAHRLVGGAARRDPRLRRRRRRPRRLRRPRLAGIIGSSLAGRATIAAQPEAPASVGPSPLLCTSAPMAPPPPPREGEPSVMPASAETGAVTGSAGAELPCAAAARRRVLRRRAAAARGDLFAELGDDAAADDQALELLEGAARRVAVLHLPLVLLPQRPQHLEQVGEVHHERQDPVADGELRDGGEARLDERLACPLPLLLEDGLDLLAVGEELVELRAQRREHALLLLRQRAARGEAADQVGVDLLEAEKPEKSCASPCV